ncbi:hypothetical protein JHK87_033827 [Glycine soja]|nr:hypothetical protein JHK87_033827 [Glycine soja]
MARIDDKIKSIDGSKETLKLAVRITKLWFVGTPGRSEQAEMIIVDSDPLVRYFYDSQGDQIHVVCKQDQLKTWKMDLKEGCTYVMHNFRVSKNDGQLSELGIEIRLVLTRRSQWSSQPSGSAQLSSRETFISKSEAKTISEINSICESADEVNSLKVEDGDLDLNASPKALDKLLGHLLAFKVKIQLQYKNSAVLKCSTDLSLINDVLDMFPDVEQSISITADHDPFIGLPLTPTKRKPFHECDDEARSSQISPAQLSSNKLAKHEQIE